MTRQQQLAIRRMWGRGLIELKRVKEMKPRNGMLDEYQEKLEADLLVLGELIEPDEDTEGT